MRRTLTLAALATAGYRLDVASAFHAPSGMHPRTVSGLQSQANTQFASPMPVPTRQAGHGPRAGATSLGMTTTGKPETGIPGKADLVGIGEGDEDAGKGATAGAHIDGEGEGVSPPAAAETDSPKIGESDYSSLEAAFADARRRSVAQQASAKAAADELLSTASKTLDTLVDTPDEESKPAGEKPTATLPSPSSVSPDPNGAAAPPTAKQQEEAPPVGAKMEEEAIAARRSRKTPEMLSEELRTAPVPRPLIARDVPPPKELKKPAAPTAPPKEAEVVQIKAATPSPAPEPKPKAEGKPKAAEKASASGAFSFGADSLEEFFGLTKRPRLVDSTTPPPDAPQPEPMAELDPKAVEDMIQENGLNEVTLKENFRKMEAEAKLARSSGVVRSSKLEPTAAAAPMAKKPSPPPPKKDDAPSPNPFAAFTSMFAPTPTTEAKATAPEPAAPVTTFERPKVTRPKTEAKPAPKAPPAPVASKVLDIPKEKKEQAREEKPSGIGGLFGGLFGAGGETFYDDEIDTLPQKVDSPRALPVFSPPPAPVKAPPAPSPAVTPAAKKSLPPAPSKAKKTSRPPSSAAPSLLDGLFGRSKGDSDKAKVKSVGPKTPTSTVAKKPASVAVKTVQKKREESSIFAGLFGGSNKDDGSSAADVAPKLVAKVAEPKIETGLFGGLFGIGAPSPKPKEAPAPAPALAPAPAPVAVGKKEDSKPAFNLFGLFGGGDGDKSSRPALSTPSKSSAAASKKKIVSTPAASPVAASNPSSAPGFFDLFRKSGSSSSSSSSTATGKSTGSTAPASPKKAEPQPAKKGPFAGLFGGGGDSEGKMKPAATMPKPKQKPKKPTPKAPPPPVLAVSRVKTMDDAFLRKVSAMLKRNQAKIKKFQQLTDRFRGGLIKAAVYYEGVDELFGEDNVEEIIGPLLAALPENDKRKTLQDVYSKAQKAKSGDASEGERGFNLFGWRSKSSTPAPAPAPTSPEKKSGGVWGLGKKGAGSPGAGGSGAGAGTPAAAADPCAFAAGKLSDSDYQLFKKRTELFARGGINARNYYDTLTRLIGKKGLSAQLSPLLKALPQKKRELLQDVYDGLK